MSNRMSRKKIELTEAQKKAVEKDPMLAHLIRFAESGEENPTFSVILKTTREE